MNKLLHIRTVTHSNQYKLGEVVTARQQQLVARYTKPTPALPLNSSAVIDRGDELIHQSTRKELKSIHWSRSQLQKRPNEPKSTISMSRLFHNLTTGLSKQCLLTYALAPFTYNLEGWPQVKELLKTKKIIEL